MFLALVDTQDGGRNAIAKMSPARIAPSNHCSGAMAHRTGSSPLLFLCRLLVRFCMRKELFFQLKTATASVALLVFCSTALCQVQPGQSVVGGPVIPPSNTPHQITATGSATVDATADRAQIRFAVECQNTDATAAQTVLTESVRRAFAAMEALGIARDAIHPSAVNVFPIYATAAGKDHAAETPGFRVGEIIEVDLEAEQLAQIGSVVETGMKSGVTRLEGITYLVSPSSRQRSRLIVKATQDAQAKAQAMAATLGVPLGAVEDASESGITVTPVASGVNGPLRMEASVTVHYNISPTVADANTIVQ
jgi:uncharacterized protein YggE